MAIKLRRGTDTQRLSVVFEEGEIAYTTDTKKLYIGDGVTAGGNEIGGTTAAELLKVEVHNATGSTVAAGAVVYLNGNTGNKPNLNLAKADSEATSSKTIGLVTASISNNANGEIATDGLLEGLNTSAFAAGDLLWLSDSVAGGVTTIIPDTPNHAVFIGYVTYAHPSNGAILIHIQNGYELNELHDVKITSVADGDVLSYDSTLGYWKNIANSSFTPPNGLLKIASAISTTFQVVKDYLDNASVLQLNSRRVGILSDSSVTTQTSSVIQATTTNANLVIAPNGNGSIVARIPDGTAVGGNARGDNSVDLQIYQSTTGVASGAVSVCGGGRANTASNNYSVVSGGYSNISSGQFSYVGAGTSNTASSNYSTISGGQSNTASTNTHATVVGGQSNTASGQYSVAGGYNNTSTAQYSVAIGGNGQATQQGAIALGYNNNATGLYSVVGGGIYGRAQSQESAIIGGSYGLGYLRGMTVTNSSNFVTFGDNQSTLIKSHREATLTTGATTVLSLDGTGTTNLIIPNGTNRAWNVQIDTIAVVTAITGTATGVSVGHCYSETKQLLFKRIGGTSSIVGTVDTTAIKSDSGMSTASITISAGGSQQMAITFTAPMFVGGGSVTCRVVSKVSLVEVAY